MSNFTAPYIPTPTIPTGTTASVALNFGDGVRVGDALTVCLSVFSPTAGVFWTLVDNKGGNTWTPGPTNSAGAGPWAISWTCVVANAGAAFTVTASSATAKFVSLYGIGATPSAPVSLDGSRVGTGTGTAPAAGSFATAGTNDLIVAFGTLGANGQTWTPGSGYTLGASNAGASNHGLPCLLEYSATNTAGTQSPAMTGSVSAAWACLAIAWADQIPPVIAPSPAAIPTGHAATIAINLVGTNIVPPWTPGDQATFNFPGLPAGTTVVGQLVNTGSTATITVTTGSTAGTLAITDGMATGDVTIGAPALAVAPTGANPNAAVALHLTGTDTVWTQEVASPLFAAAGTPGCGLSSISVTSDTTATATLASGTATGTVVVTDNSTGATANVTVAAQPPFGPVYAAGPVAGSLPSISLNFGSQVAAGDVVIAAIAVFKPSGAAFTCSDNYNAGNWTLIDSVAAGVPGAYAWRSTPALAGPNFTVTVAPVVPATYLLTIAGIGTTPAAAVVADGLAASSGSGTVAASGNFATGGTGDMIVLVAVNATNANGWTPAAGYVDAVSYAGTGSVGLSMVLAYHSLTNSPGTYDPSATANLSGGWSAIGFALAGEFVEVITATPAAVAPSIAPLSIMLAATHGGTPWDGNTTFSCSGLAGASLAGWSVTSGSTATILLDTGPTPGTVTIANSSDPATVAVAVRPQAMLITCEVSTCGQLLVVTAQSNTPATNGYNPELAVTAINSDPAVGVNGASVAIGARTWASSAKNLSCFFYLLPRALSPADAVTLSWGDSWFTAGGVAALAQAVAASNWTGRVEPEFVAARTMVVGGNIGAAPSASTGNNFLNKNLLMHGGAWLPGANTTILAVDSLGFPTSWTPGGSVIQWVNGTFDANQVDGQGLPTAMGAYTAQYDDPQVGTANQWTATLTGNHNVTIGAPARTVAGTVVTVAWDVEYVPSAAFLEPFLEINISSAPGLWRNPTDPNLWVFAPGDTVDRSDPLATSAAILARVKSPGGKYPAWWRGMDATTGGFGGLGNQVYPADLIEAGRAYWNYARPVPLTPLPFPVVRFFNPDPAKGPAPGGDGTYAWVSTRYYGDQSPFCQGPDSFGMYLPIAATDAGSSLFPPQTNGQAVAYFELRFPAPHGLKYGYEVSISGPRPLVTNVVNNGSGLCRVTTATAHPFATGNPVHVFQVAGATEANGTWTVAVIDGFTFDLEGSTYSTAYTGGGKALLAIPCTNGTYITLTNASDWYYWVTGPDTIAGRLNVSGSAPAQRPAQWVLGTAEIPTQWVIAGTAPAQNAGIPFGALARLCAQTGADYWLNLPLSGTAAVWQRIAADAAAETPTGGTIGVELGNEVWNVGFPSGGECARLAVTTSYLPTGTVLFGGRYTVTNGVQVPGGSLAVYALMAAAAQDVVAAELAAIGRSDIIVKRIVGSQWGGVSVTQTIAAACSKFGLHFDMLAVAPYLSLGTDAPFKAAFAPNSSWTVAAMCDLNKHVALRATDRQAKWSGHYQALPPGVQLVCYEGFPQRPLPAEDGAQLHDILAHPLWAATMEGYLLSCQRGDPATSGSGAVLMMPYQVFSVPGSFNAGGSWMLICGNTQVPGPGLSNRFATAQGGAPADGASHYGPSWTGSVRTFAGNESPGAWGWLAWIDGSSPPPPPPPPPTLIRLDWRRTTATPIPTGWQP